MENSWISAYNMALPLIGVAVGAAATFITQTQLGKKQLARDLAKDKEIKNIERLSVYSEVMKLKGEDIMFGYNGYYPEFDLPAYKKKFRPVLFSRFYLLHQDIADGIQEMDDIIAEAEINGVLERNHSDQLLNLFNELILSIEVYLKEYRVSYNN